MIRVIFFLSAILISFGVHSQSRVYENKEGNYKISIPENWKERVNGTTTDIFAPDDSELDVWQEFVGVSLSESNDLTLDETFTYYMSEDFPGYYTKFKIIKQGEEIIDDQKCKWALYAFSNSTKGDATTFYNLFYLTLKQDTLYSLNAIAEKTGYSTLEPQFLTIIRSFQINP